MIEEPWTKAQHNLARSVLRLYPDVDIQRLVKCVTDLVHDPDEMVILLAGIIERMARG